MFLLNTGIQGRDLFLAPLCFMTLLMIFSVVLRKYRDEKLKRLFLQAFYFKMGMVLLFTLVIMFVYRGGDTALYYDATMNLHKAVLDDPGNFFKIYTTKVINVKTPLMDYFIYSNSIYPVWEAMHNAGNFLVPKLALPVSLVFDRSYLCINMVFAFFALGGAIRLFKFFYHYYPQYYREVALATLFIPSVAFWSSGLLKDPICFGAVGYMVYAVFSIFIRKKKIISSVFWLAFTGVLLFYIKPYILLALSPALVIWLFRELNKLVENKTLRNIMAFFTFAIGAGLAILLINSVTSNENLQAYRLDSLLETSSQQRDIYETFGDRYEGSYFKTSSNPVLMILNGLTATLFRPFLWEARNVTAMMSAFEALLFLYLTLLFFFKKGIKAFFRSIFSQPVLFLCFLFSVVFAAAVGSTSLNFGSLSRYKIPALPFYLLMILILFQKHDLQYPRWFKKLMGYKSAPRWVAGRGRKNEVFKEMPAKHS